MSIRIWRRSGWTNRETTRMSAAKGQMHLGVFVLGTGNHSAGWRYEGAATSNNDLSVTQEIARIAERGKFDLLFISDGLVMDPGDHPSFLCRFEPTTLISVLSAATRHIGLGATVSTSFGEPYHGARTFASIDHISNGRAAWNVVTGSAPRAALNFSRERHREHFGLARVPAAAGSSEAVGLAWPQPKSPAPPKPG